MFILSINHTQPVLSWINKLIKYTCKPHRMCLIIVKHDIKSGGICVIETLKCVLAVLGVSKITHQ